MLDCLQMQSCAVYVTKSKKNTCLCTRKLCLKIKCSSVPQKDCTQLAVTCKLEKVGTNHSDCVTNTITDNHTGKRTPQSRSTFKNPKTVWGKTVFYKKKKFNFSSKLTFWKDIYHDLHFLVNVIYHTCINIKTRKWLKLW